jgi:hypothetical protein
VVAQTRAEWLTVIELVRRATALKTVGLTVNILIVLHLVRIVRGKGRAPMNAGRPPHYRTRRP